MAKKKIALSSLLSYSLLLLPSVVYSRSLYKNPENVSDWSLNPNSLAKRQDNGPIQCSASTECADASCCNSLGKCGYTPDHCAPKSPVTCLSNCKATAMCGKYSPGGNKKCGLNICCSYFGWCGTTPLHCINADPKGNTLPCQAGFGLCQVIPPPKCGTGSGTASNGRKIGYYQVANMRTRACQQVRPSQLVTSGFTQLNLAFAFIQPGSYQVVPQDPADLSYYLEFTGLKSSTLKTWIAIGGFDFSDPGSTHTTWSDMVSSSTNRALFIDSIIAFMKRWGFQGADLDWEYPTAPERGGRETDPGNYVQLVREMKAAFDSSGGGYGLSVVLAPDYWYLRGMDPKAMEPYVDQFGFMSYDLHGAWDGKNPTLGPKIRAQTDVREIYNNTLPLWFAALQPAKINFGIAYYGRGYTVADTGCRTLGCTFSGPNKKASCTNFDGVMSNKEIEAIISSKGVQPTLLSGPMIKELKWDDQWMGYDDDETIAMKLGVANDLCMGGSMVWSVDFDRRIESGVDNSGGPSTPSVNPTSQDRLPYINGDALLIFSIGTKLGSSGDYRWQYQYHNVRGGSTVSLQEIFEKNLEPSSVSKQMAANFDPLTGSPPNDGKYRDIFGRKCAYSPPASGSSGAGSLKCLDTFANTQNAAKDSPDNTGSRPARVFECERPKPTNQFNVQCVGPQALRCGTLYGVCHFAEPDDLSKRAGDPALVAPLNLREITIDFMQRMRRGNTNIFQRRTLLFYTRRNGVYDPFDSPLSPFARDMARRWGYLTIWDGWPGWPTEHIDGAQQADFFDIDDPTGLLGAIRYAPRETRQGRPPAPVPDDSDQTEYFRRMSATYALNAAGTVYVMTETPRNIRRDAIWGTVEYPILTRSGYLDRVTGRTHYNFAVTRIIATNLRGTDFYLIYDSSDGTVSMDNPTWLPNHVPPRDRGARSLLQMRQSLPGSSVGDATCLSITDPFNGLDTCAGPMHGNQEAFRSSDGRIYYSDWFG